MPGLAEVFDQALAEKLFHDLDKPKSEVLIDIIVMEASSIYTRQLTAALVSDRRVLNAYEERVIVAGVQLAAELHIPSVR